MTSSEPKHYDAFLSYNSQDRLAVKDLAGRLDREGLVLYLDEWELTPGREFQPALAGGLRDSTSCVVFLGRNGLAPWQKQEIQVAIDRRTHDEAFHVIPVLLPGTERPRRGDVAHLEFLVNASWVEFLETLDDERAFRRLVWGIKGTKPKSTVEPQYAGICPYRGLEAFRPEDERFFFGRDSLTGWLVSALRREVRAKAQGVRFLGVIGPSGSGKSSVVLAGLVPKLKAGAIEGSERWPVAILRPGDDPLMNLAARVIPSLQAPGTTPDIDSVYKLIKALREDKDAQALDIFARSALHDRPEDVRLLVVVDQFEELFTYRPQDGTARERFERDRAAYLANLLNAAAAPGGRAAVLLTMRSDFLGACATYPQLSAVLSAHQELVGPMTPPELREAIVQPAFLVGHEVEPALIERLLGDVKGQTGALPLLQFALTEVWKKRDVGRLTLRAYEELGEDEHGRPRGIEGALEHRANEIYNKLDRADQDLCRRIFLRLVQPGEGIEDTKRRVSYHELLPANPERAEAVRKLIHTLSEREARLITTEAADASEGWVEVAHEALIRGWTQLRQWVDVDRAGLRTQRRLTEAAHEWAAARPEDKGGHLYSGTRLAVCREWVKLHPDELGSIEAEFLSTSEAAERQREQDALEKERRLREAAVAAQEAERKRAEEAEARKQDAEAATEKQKRLGQRLLVSAIVAGLLAITSGGLAWWANRARRDADRAAVAATTARNKASEALKKADAAATSEREAARLANENEGKAKAQARLAESRRLAALSRAERDERLDRALLLAVEANDTANTLEARNMLFGSLVARPGLTAFLQLDQGYGSSLAFSPDGKTLASGYFREYGGGGVVLWDTTRHARLQVQPMAVPEGGVESVAFSLDGKTLAAGCAGGDGGGVVLWDTTRRSRLQDQPLAVAEGQVASVSFSPDGKTLAAGYRGSVGGSGGVVLWDTTRRARLQDQPLAVTEGYVRSVAFSPDGKTLAAGYQVVPIGGGGGVVLWDTTRRARLQDQPLAVAAGYVASVAFSPDGKTLAAGCRDIDGGGIHVGVVLWDTTRRARLQDQPLAVAEGRVASVAFSPDGRTLAAGYSGRGRGGVVLWDTARRARLQDQPLAVAEGDVWSAAFCPDGKTLAAGYRDFRVGMSGVVLWDTTRRARLQDQSLAVAEGRVASVAFSPDGKTLAAGYGSVGRGGVVLWDTTRRARLHDQPLVVAEGDVWSVAFSPDCKTLAAGYGGVGGVVLWDATRRARLQHQPLAVVEGHVASVAFSPDGKTLAAGYGRVGDGGGVVLWDTTRRARLLDQPLAAAEGWVRSLAFSPDGKTLAAGYGSVGRGGVVLWDTTRSSRLLDQPLAVTEGDVGSAAFSPDGKTLVAGYGFGGGGVVLWDTARRSRIQDQVLAVGEGRVASVAFSPDGKTLAAGYGKVGGGGVVLWDATLRSRLQDQPLAIAEGFVASVAFSPDGKTLAAGYRGDLVRGGVALWDVDLASWRRHAGAIANRNFTREEWQEYFPDQPYRKTFDWLPEAPEMKPAAEVKTSLAHPRRRRRKTVERMATKTFRFLSMDGGGITGALKSQARRPDLCKMSSSPHPYRTANGSASPGAAHHFGLDDLRGQAEMLQHENRAIGEVEFPPAMPDRRRGGIVVMVVMPSLAQAHHPDEPVVPAALVRLVVAVAEEVGERVHRPRHMPSQHGAHQAPPDEQTQAELEGPHGGPGRHPADRRARDQVHEQVSHVNRGAQIALLESHVERVLENIMRILLHRSDGSGRRVLIEQPVEVRPEEVDERAVGVGPFVGKSVMHPVNGHPLGRSVLQGTLGEQGDAVLEPPRHHQAAVSQQSVIPQCDSEAIEGHTEYSQSQAGPGEQPGDEGRQGRQMDRHDRDDVKPDYPVETHGGRSRQPRGIPMSALRRGGRDAVSDCRRRRAGITHERSIPSIRMVFLPAAVACALAGVSSWSRRTVLMLDKTYRVLSTIAPRLASECLPFSPFIMRKHDFPRKQRVNNLTQPADSTEPPS